MRVSERVRFVVVVVEDARGGGVPVAIASGTDEWIDIRQRRRWRSCTLRVMSERVRTVYFERDRSATYRCTKQTRRRAPSLPPSRRSRGALLAPWPHDASARERDTKQRRDIFGGRLAIFAHRKCEQIEMSNESSGLSSLFALRFCLVPSSPSLTHTLPACLHIDALLVARHSRGHRGVGHRGLGSMEASQALGYPGSIASVADQLVRLSLALSLCDVLLLAHTSTPCTQDSASSRA